MSQQTQRHAALSDELLLLIEEQSKDDTYVISRPNMVSLDSLPDSLGLDETGEIIDFTPKVSVVSGKHGATAYAKGCRCDECKKARAENRRDYQREYMRSYRAKRVQQAAA